MEALNTFSTSGTVTKHGDDVICVDFTGLTAQGDRPQRLHDECGAALHNISDALAREGLTLQDTRHIAAMLRSGDEFAQCDVVISDALGQARPAITLRIVQNFPHPDQRIALSLIASRS